ncbi:hypothetical protein HPB48_002733 [Haemaphysalis longicornis]|uniref:C2H2-type domain-containing protein n=1 Tax=Haemaphysalis longicornis TaxID=44386 RepID=A0A9J6GQI7_HAELO|nr:hypothetical protein HPB48_002733 [Haemaphysalis longicornis]
MAFGRRHFLVKHLRAVHNVDLTTDLEHSAIRRDDAPEPLEPEAKNDITADTVAVPAADPPTVYHCQVCRKEFHQRYNLRRHMRSQHAKESTECHFCGKVFKRMSGLKTHELTHTGQRPYVCSSCGRTFTQKHHMMRHQLVHAPKFNIVCSICHKGFRYASNFFEHVAIHDDADKRRDGEAKAEVEEDSEEEVKAKQHEDGADSPNQESKTHEQFELVPVSEDASAPDVAVKRTSTPLWLRDEYVPIDNFDMACMFCAKMIIDPCELTEHLLEHCHELSESMEGSENKTEDEADEILGL